MEYKNINQYCFDFGESHHRENILSLVDDNNDIFELIAKLIDQAKHEMARRMLEDPFPEIYQNKTCFATTLTEIIKAHIDRAIKDQDHPSVLFLKKAYYYQCEYYVLGGKLSLYIKKLDKKGRPSYAESIASYNRLENNERLPCVFIGPRTDKYGAIGSTCVSIVNGTESWFKEISIQESISIESYNIVADINNDDIYTINEEKVSERKIKKPKAE